MGPLATHRFLTRLALAMVHAFAWLFVFQYFYQFSGSLTYSLASAALAYALTQALAVLITPFAAKRLRHGVRGMMVNAMLALSAGFAVLAATFCGCFGPLSFGILVFCLCMAVYRALYWMPYEIASKKTQNDAYSNTFFAIVPAISGMYMMTSAFAPVVVLFIASVVCLAAIIPLYSAKNTQEGFSWNYRETFRHLFTRSHRLPLVQAIFNGFEGAALLLMWPIVVLVLLDWSYALLGIVLSFTLLLTMAARHFIHPVREHIQTPVLHSTMTLTGWVLRGTVAAPVAIVLVDTYFQAGSGVAQRGIDFVTSEQSADSNSYIDEFTALKDMGQGIGRVAFCVLTAVFSGIFSFAGATLLMFALAGLLAVASVGIGRHIARHAL